MDIFKGDHTHWYVIAENAKEKKQIFKLIGKRNRTAIYFHPDGRKTEQFPITVKEADILNEHVR